MKRYTVLNPLKYPLLLIILFLLCANMACKKFVDTPLPASKIPAELALASDGSLVSALLGAYAAVTNTTVFTTCYFSDELIFSNAATSTLQAQENTYTPDVDYGYFSNYYKAIYNANLILEALNKSNTITPAVAKQVKGECEFLRAFSYYRLISFYGSVPLVLTTNVEVSATQGNTPVAQIYDQIIKDLQDAKTLLPAAYPSADRVRANQSAVSALLARVYLLKEDWANAELESTQVISSADYKMPADLNAVFVKGSTETIWQLWNVNGYTPGGATFLPSVTSSVFYRLRDGLVNAFPATDKRKAAWIKAGTGASANFYYPNKYKQRVAVTSAAAEYLVEFRLAEQYLIRSESRAHQNKIADGLSDLNVVHGRANTVLFTSADQSDLLLKIEQERRLELMTEEGLRWFDLNRTGRTAFWLAPIKPTFTARAVLLPYPTSVLMANPNLMQNPGY